MIRGAHFAKDDTVDMKEFFQRLPQIIQMVEGGLTLAGTKSERITKLFAIVEQLSALVSASFAMAISRGESPRPGGVTATPGAMTVTVSPEPMTDEQAISALRHLSGSPAAQSVASRPDGEAAANLSMPDFGSIQFFPLAEWGIRTLFRLAQEAKQRKKRSDTGAVKASSVKAESVEAEVKPKSKGRKKTK